MNRQRGKRTQSAVAGLVFGKDIGTLGGEDVLTERYSIETKDRAKFVGEGWMKQCEENNTDNKIPAVIIHIRGSRHVDNLVMFRMGEFIEMLRRDKAIQEEMENMLKRASGVDV